MSGLRSAAAWLRAMRAGSPGERLACFDVSCSWTVADPAVARARGVLVNLNQESLLGSLAVKHALASIMHPVPEFIVNLAWPFHPFGWGPENRTFVLIKFLSPRWTRPYNLRVMSQCAKELKSGRLARVYMSIEGQRRPEPGRGPYRQGAAHLAIKAGRLPIFPVIVRGSRSLMPYGEWRIRPGHVTIHFLPAVPSDGSPAEITARLEGVYDEFTRLHPE